MYKKQMYLQRIICYLLLALSALVFIYSLGIMTDLYDSLFLVSSYKEGDFFYVKGSEVYREMQEFNRQFTVAGIAMILSSVSLFVFGNSSRRRYYIANYITVGINTVLNIGISVWALSNISKYKEMFLNVDFEKLREVGDMLSLPYTESTFWFDIGTYLFIPVLLVTLISVMNLVFKIALMRGEAALIKEGEAV